MRKDELSGPLFSINFVGIENFLKADRLERQKRSERDVRGM